jgi:hypothetical protein
MVRIFGFRITSDDLVHKVSRVRHAANQATLGISEMQTIFSTQVSCVKDSPECRFWVAVAMAILMGMLQFPR